MFSTNGGHVLGLSSNGLLSVISLVVGAGLIGAAVRGGPAAFTVTMTVGAAFLLSGMANVLVLDTPLTVLASGMSHVLLSLLAGAVVVFPGRPRRFTGGLPLSNPTWGYRRIQGELLKTRPPGRCLDDPADPQAPSRRSTAPPGPRSGSRPARRPGSRIRATGSSSSG
jgi:Domain of unknown function (DUF4383)